MTTLPYETASNGDRALAEAQRMLARFNVQAFGAMTDYERDCIIVQFRHGGRHVHVEASIKGYADAWLKHHPHSSRVRASRDEHMRKAQNIARHAVCSILRDWIKAQVTAVETGVFSFEAAFIAQTMLPGGITVAQYVDRQHLLPSGQQQ